MTKTPKTNKSAVKKTAPGKKEKSKGPAWLRPSTEAQGNLRFACVPVQLMLDKRLSTSAIRAFIALATFADMTGFVGKKVGNRLFVPGLARLAAFAGIGRSTLSAGLKQLSETGWVRERQRWNLPTLYWVRLPEDLNVFDVERQEWSAVPDSKSLTEDEWIDYENEKVLDEIDPRIGVSTREFKRLWAERGDFDELYAELQAKVLVSKGASAAEIARVAPHWFDETQVAEFVAKFAPNAASTPEAQASSAPESRSEFEELEESWY